MRIFGWAWILVALAMLGATGWAIQYRDLAVPLVLLGGIGVGSLFGKGVDILRRHPKKKSAA